MIREQAETLASPVGRSGRGARRRRAARLAHVGPCPPARGCGSDLTNRQSRRDHRKRPARAETPGGRRFRGALRSEPSHSGGRIQ